MLEYDAVSKWQSSAHKAALKDAPVRRMSPFTHGAGGGVMGGTVVRGRRTGRAIANEPK